MRDDVDVGHASLRLARAILLHPDGVVGQEAELRAVPLEDCRSSRFGDVHPGPDVCDAVLVQPLDGVGDAGWTVGVRRISRERDEGEVRCAQSHHVVRIRRGQHVLPGRLGTPRVGVLEVPDDEIGGTERRRDEIEEGQGILGHTQHHFARRDHRDVVADCTHVVSLLEVGRAANWGASLCSSERDTRAR